ncbi:histidine-rich glycoprotein-like [Fagus crenata]
MASMQCYKPTYEACQQKCNESSHGHRMADMNSWGMKANHQGHHAHAGYGMANSETYRHGQSHAYNPDHNMTKTQQSQYNGQTQSHYPDHTMSKTHQSYNYHSQTNGHHPSDYHAMAAHGNDYGHGQAYGHHASSHAMACHSKTEKKMKEKGCEYKKEKTLYKKKSKASKRSCSDNDSGSDSD